MAINLKDFTDAVKFYLENKVKVQITSITPDTGTNINPNETFKVHLSVANSTAADGGVPLNNVRYRLAVDNADVATLKVPATASGIARDVAGNLLAAGTFVKEMIFDPTSAAFDLPEGDTDTLTIAGKAGPGLKGGNTTIRARVLAKLNLDQDTAVVPRTLTVFE